MRRFLFVMCMMLTLWSSAAAREEIYVFRLKENVSMSSVRHTARCLRQARQRGASIVAVETDISAGLTDAADSISKMIRRSPIPVCVFVSGRATGPGALVAMGAERIYMSPDGVIGNATAVNCNGRTMPDDVQSSMRTLMRSAAESHGRQTVFRDGDTLCCWVRDPELARAMTGFGSRGDAADSAVTLSARQALSAGLSSGTAETVEELFAADYDIFRYRPSALQRALGMLSGTVFQCLMVMLIVAGVYFELQSPGVGLPLCAALTGALLFFAPLCAEGVVEHWEILTFLAGVLLVALELLITPGFGMFGIMGVTAMIFGLTFAIIDRDLLRYIPSGEIPASYLIKPLCTVEGSIVLSLIISMWAGHRLQRDGSLAMRPSAEHDTGPDALTGRTGIVSADLNPAGRIYVDGTAWAAESENGEHIFRDERVVIVRCQNGTVYCRRETLLTNQ